MECSDKMTNEHPFFMSNNLINNQSTILKKSSNCTSSVLTNVDEVSFDTKRINQFAGSFLTQATAADNNVLKDKLKRALRPSDYINTRGAQQKKETMSKTMRRPTNVKNDLKTQIANQTAALVMKRNLSLNKSS